MYTTLPWRFVGVGGGTTYIQATILEEKSLSDVIFSNVARCYVTSYIYLRMLSITRLVRMTSSGVRFDLFDIV